MTTRERIILKVGRWIRKLQTRSEMIEASLLCSKMQSCGRDVTFLGRVFMSGVENVTIGNNVTVAENAYIRAEGGLSIGDNAHISRNLTLYTVNHQYEGECLPYDVQLICKPVVIGRNAWIGMNVCITPGTTIGDGAIIGMGCVLSGDIPPLSIVGNQKWRILKMRNPEHYEQLDAVGAYGGIGGRPLPRIHATLE